MKWNDAWLDNKDCDDGAGGDPDGLFDRHFGYPTYIGSGAWLTNEQAGWDEDPNKPGKDRKWTYFVKIIAVAEDAYCDPEVDPAKYWVCTGTWYTAEGIEIGPAIWESFAIIQEVVNDPFNGFYGIQYVSPAGPGFGAGHIQ